jgi:hypothetical protein
VLAVLATFELQPYVLRDTPSRRLVRSFGLAEITLEPRSAYVLSGPARTQWQHHIPAVTQERWWMTFRTLRHAAASTR